MVRKIKLPTIILTCFTSGYSLTVGIFKTDKRATFIFFNFIDMGKNCFSLTPRKYGTSYVLFPTNSVNNAGQFRKHLACHSTKFSHTSDTVQTLLPRILSVTHLLRLTDLKKNCRQRFIHGNDLNESQNHQWYNHSLDENFFRVGIYNSAMCIDDKKKKLQSSRRLRRKLGQVQ